MSRAAKVALGALAAVIGFNVALSLIGSLTGGTPGGPASSSYATDSTGLAAYAALLARAGHGVEQLREPPHAARLDPDATYVLLDPAGPLAASDAAALRRVADAGARLILGGSDATWVDAVVSDGPRWSATGVRSVEPLAPLPALAGVGHLPAPGAGSWLGGGALPALGAGSRALVALARVGRGEAWLLASAAPLQNSHLAAGDDAALALALAGPPSRPVVFLEAYHGFGPASGLAAVPTRWWVSFGVLAVAVALLMLAAGRRLGPPQPDARALPPARRLYVESLAGILARTRSPEEATRALRAQARHLLALRAGLGSEPPESALRVSATQLGITATELDALLAPVHNDEQALALGAAYVRLTRESRR